MKTLKNAALPLAAGLLGGLLSHYAMMPSVHAQSQYPVPKKIRAQSFVLMNEKNEVGGILAFDNDGKPMMQLYEKGREVWSAGGKQFRQLGK